MDIGANKSFERCYFALLPNELLIQVFKYLNTQELVNFCVAYKDSGYFFQQKPFFSKLNITQCYNNVQLFFTSSIDHSIVTCLNLNDCHWIPADILRSFVGKLKNLKELQAVRTKLAFSEADIASYRKTKVNKIALTLTGFSGKNKGVKTLATITTLGLDLRNVTDFRKHIDKLRFPNLKKLWIECRIGFDPQYLHYYACNWLTSQHSNNLQSLIFSPEVEKYLSKVPLTRYYCGRKMHQPQLSCFELLNSPKENIELPPSWQVLADAHIEMPFGPKDAKLLYSGKETLETIQFQEFNFQHNLVCGGQDIEVVNSYKEILNSPNSYSVKKLSIACCLLDTSTEQNRRTDIDCNKTSNESVLSNLNEIRHLELFTCPCATTFDGYNSISNFAQLRYLYVQITTTNDGEFLLDVSKNCPYLETLWIYSFQLNEELNYNVLKALEHTTNLKEFTFRNDRLRIYDFICLFSNSKTIKLRKLCLGCADTDRFSHDLLSKYLNGNPQLMYCLINIGNHKPRQDLPKRMAEASKMPHRILVICNTSNDPKQPRIVRDIIQEMQEFKSSTCFLSLKEEFGSF